LFYVFDFGVLIGMNNEHQILTSYSAVVFDFRYSNSAYFNCLRRLHCVQL